MLKLAYYAQNYVSIIPQAYICESLVGLVICEHILCEVIFPLHLHQIIFISYSQPSPTTDNLPCLFCNWGHATGQVLSSNGMAFIRFTLQGIVLLVSTHQVAQPRL